MGYRISEERFKEIAYILDKLPDLKLNTSLRVSHPDPIQLKRIRSTIYEWLAVMGLKRSFRVKQIHPLELLVIKIGIDVSQAVVIESRVPAYLDPVIQAIIATESPLSTVERMREDKQFEPEVMDLLEKEVRRIFE